MRDLVSAVENMSVLSDWFHIKKQQQSYSLSLKTQITGKKKQNKTAIQSESCAQRV